MIKATDFAAGMALGAGMMYLLDPDRGNRRRALMRDQVVHGGHELGDMKGEMVSSVEDLRNRARGAAAETRARMRNEQVSDPVLEERVRSELGRAVSNPGSIQVTSNEGRVVLHGSVLAGEVDELLSDVAGVRGVKGVDNQLDVQERPGDAPGLQGLTH